MKKSGLIAICVLLALGVGMTAWRYSEQDNRSAQNSASSNSDNAEEVSLVTTAAMEKEEAKYRTYTGEDYDRYYMATMIGHHQSAVEMAQLAQTNAKHQELKSLANNIISAQNEEITRMTGWQQAWGYPASYGPNMVDHSAMTMMEDMAPQMEELKTLTGDAFDKSFVSMMVEHHESAIAMSRPAATNAQHQEIKDLAAKVIKAQTAEVLQMRGWHKEWGYGAVPNSSSDATSGAMGHDMSNM